MTARPCTCGAVGALLMLFTLAACSDDPAQNPDAGVTQDKGNGTQEGGAGDGKITDGPKKGDGKVVDAKPP